MKQFDESMIRNYTEFNNWGTFEIEGYFVKFVNDSKILETDYPYKEQLRIWWFNADEIGSDVYYKSKYDIERMLNRIAKDGCGYLNGVVAKGINIGKQKQMNDNWVKNICLRSEDEGIINYEQASRLYYVYVDFLKKTFHKIRNIKPIY